LKYWLIFSVIMLALCVSVFVGARAVRTMDIRQYAEKHLTQSLGRKVTLGALTIDWRNPLRVELSDLHLANAPWGSEPDMMQIGHMAAVIDIGPLLHGVIQYRMMRMEDFSILLERNAQGVGNWRLDGKLPDPHRPVPHGGLAAVPKNRTQFPNMLDMVLHNGVMRLRTSSGKILKLQADEMRVAAANGGAPVQMSLHGNYNDTPAQIHVMGQSFQIMRDGDVPYGAQVEITTPENDLHFDGTMMNPLDIDGDKGRLKISSNNFGTLLGLLDMQSTANLPFTIAGDFTRSGDDWEIAQANTKLASSDFVGDLKLHEGARAHADSLAFDLSSNFIDVKKLSDGFGTGSFFNSSDFIAEPGTNFDAHLRANNILYRNFQIQNSESHLTLHPGELKLDVPSAQLIGGQSNFHASIVAQDQGRQYNISSAILGGNLDQLLKILGEKSQIIHGVFNAEVNMHMTGKTWQNAMQDSRGDLAFLMTSGDIRQSLLEDISGDVRIILRAKEGRTPINCLATKGELRNGTINISSLILRTPQLQAGARGSLDILHRHADIILQSNPETTGAFATDIPIHISGSITDLSFSPMFGENFSQPKNICP
jgi:uncharacterized protein involved in outer membrane biogenesis